MRTSSWMTCARSCQPTNVARAEGVSFKADSMHMVDMAAKKVKFGGDSIRIICHISAVKMVLLIRSSLLLRLRSEFSPYSEPPFQVRQAAFKIHDVETSVMLHYNHRRGK